MHIFSIVFLGIAANLDNLGIGLAYGVRKVKISFISNLIISVLSGIAVLMTSFAGALLKHILPGYICNVLGGCIVSIVGVWVIVSNFANKKLTSFDPGNEQRNNANATNLCDIIRQPEKADMDYSGHISIKESIFLGIALSINCLAAGLGGVVVANVSPGAK